MRINMGIVGVPNVTVSVYSTDGDANVAQEIASRNPNKDADTDVILSRVAFDSARRRLAMQGARDTRFFRHGLN